MAYEIGICDNYKDALTRLKDLLSNPARTTGDDSDILELSPIPADQAYTVLDYSTDFDGNGNIQLYLKGTGYDGQDEIFTGIQTYFHEGQDYYNWHLQGYTGYDEGLTFDTQEGAITKDINNTNPKVLLWNEKIKYWFAGNGRRYVGFLKVNTVYESFWGGFPILYGLPLDTQTHEKYYPLIVGGSSCGYESSYPKRFSSIEAGHRAFWDGYYASGRSTIRMLWDGNWLSGGNWSANSDTGYSFSRINVWPYLHSDYYDSSNNMPQKYLLNMKENIDGSRPPWPLIISSGTPEINIYGQLQGLYAVPGFGGLAPEDRLVDPVTGDVMVVFPNIYRNYFNNFVALLLE